jgi:hypothetical protein
MLELVRDGQRLQLPAQFGDDLDHLLAVENGGGLG